MINQEEQTKIVIEGISSIILQEMRMLANEQYRPMRGADESDEVISDYKKRVKKLRTIREQFEDTVAGVLWSI